MPAEHLLRIAESVSDGIETNWLEVEASAAETERMVVRALGLLERVASVHRSLHEAIDGREALMPKRWGSLDLSERIGGGANGEVYRALDLRLDREVALKLLRYDASESAEGAIREGKLLARVKHPNVATVYGADRRNGQVGLWMELVCGRTLAAIVHTDGPFGAREAALIGRDLCRAVAAVHAAGILHRDIKAQNVMREQDGRIVLMDFGIGRELHDGEQATPSLSGTPLYLAPELLEGQPPDRRTDVYSTGVVLYHLVTGSYPAVGRSLRQIRDAHRQGRRKLLRDARPDLPADFLNAVEKAIEPDPEKRHATPGELERGLEATLGYAAQRSRWPRLVFAVLALLAAGLFFLPQSKSDSAEVVTTSSPEALALYRRAGELYPRRIEEAIAALEVAIVKDPELAMGYHRLAVYHDALGKYVLALELSDRAFEHRGRASMAERTMIEGTYFLYRQRYRDSLAAFQKAAHSGGAADALPQIAMLRANLGQRRLAIRATEDALEAAPDNLFLQGLLVIHHAEAAEGERARRELPGLLTHGLSLMRRLPTGWQGIHRTLRHQAEAAKYLDWAEGLAWLIDDRHNEAVAAFQRMLTHEDIYASHGYRMLAQVRVRQALDEEPPTAEPLAQAAEALEEGLILDRKIGNTAEKARKLHHLAAVRRLQGRTDEALELLREIHKLPAVPLFLKHFRDAALLHAELKDLSGLSQLANIIADLCDRYEADLCSTTRLHLAAFEHLLRSQPEAARTLLARHVPNYEDPSTFKAAHDLQQTLGNLDRATTARRNLYQARGRVLSQHFAGLLQIVTQSSESGKIQ